MSDPSRDYRGGEIQLSADRLRGLPFLKPLYGLPPYQYTDDVVLMIMYKEIPSIAGTKCDDAYFVTSTARVSNLSFKAGGGKLDFPDPGDDPVARLEPVKISSALHGTMDDLYPESIRVVRDLREKL